MTSGRLELGPRRGYAVALSGISEADRIQPDKKLVKALAEINLLYRTLVSIMYNCAFGSGHPGGSISSSRMVEGLIYNIMDYDFSNPEAPDADVLSYAAGHKALGLYTMWALRNEVVRATRPELLPEEKRQLRLEDLLGFRRNPTQHTELYKKFNVKPLDGHPTPATPFVKLATGASGVGVASSFGLAFSALDLYPDDPPQIHIIEGEGGLTPGRVQEAMAAAATMRLHNIVLHVDYNQASIDSNHVCRDNDRPGDYVQWDPVELARFHDFNVVLVEDGMNHSDVLIAQVYAQKHKNYQPTCIVYRTHKGWKYGILGKASHGAGHKVCSDDFYQSLEEFELCYNLKLPKLEGEVNDASLEKYFYELLMQIRKRVEDQKPLFMELGNRLAFSKERLKRRGRQIRADAPDLSRLYDGKTFRIDAPPPEVLAAPGKRITLRESLGEAMNHISKACGGAFVAAAADLLNSTSVSKVGKGFPEGFYNAASNPRCRLLSIGGICEDAMGAFLSAAGVDGRHIGVGSSYGAFIAPLQHVAVRLHCIGQQAREHTLGIPYTPYIMVCAHAGLKTGEDGPTHADPQCLQLLQENFPKGTMITLTPWDPNELWPCLVASLQKRPAVVAPFVTRPPEKVFDRKALRLPDASAAAKGIYALRKADPAKKPYHGTLVLQGSGETNAFVDQVLPRLDANGVNMNIYYVSSAELFDLLPDKERESIFPEAHAREAMGITGFTLPTLYRFVTSEAGRKASLHAFSTGHYLGSGQAHKVLEEGGLDPEGQFKSILKYIESFAKGGAGPNAKPKGKAKPKARAKAKPKSIKNVKSKPKRKSKSKGGKK
jgi:transketolase